MPTYLYKCSSCEQEAEVVQKITDEPVTLCPYCNKEHFKRIPARSLSIQISGSGYYKTDYANKPQNPGCGGSCSCH